MGDSERLSSLTVSPSLLPTYMPEKQLALLVTSPSRAQHLEECCAADLLIQLVAGSLSHLQQAHPQAVDLQCGMDIPHRISQPWINNFFAYGCHEL